MGRKSKYDEPLVDRLLTAIRLGATYKLACCYAGISVETLNVWRKEKPGFSEALDRANGEAGVNWLQQIEHAATAGNWRAAAWKLERRFPQEYGKRQTRVLEGQADKPAAIITIREVPSRTRLRESGGR